MFLEQVKIIIHKCFQKNVNTVYIDDIEICSYSDSKSSDEENSDEEKTKNKNYKKVEYMRNYYLAHKK